MEGLLVNIMLLWIWEKWTDDDADDDDDEEEMKL